MKSMLASMAVVVTFCAAPAVTAEFPNHGAQHGRSPGTSGSARLTLIVAMTLATV
jgi:hypothetical protein